MSGTRHSLELNISGSLECLFFSEVSISSPNPSQVLSKVRSTVAAGPSERGHHRKFVIFDSFYFLILMLHSNSCVVYGRHFRVWNSFEQCHGRRAVVPRPSRSHPVQNTSDSCRREIKGGHYSRF